MTNFISALTEVIEKLGLILAPALEKMLNCFYNAGTNGGMIPCALLKGIPGAGKTSTAEAFALAVGGSKFFYQCNPGTGFDQLIGQPNLGAVLRQDASCCISDGILIQAVKAAMSGQDVVLILDEIDKSSPEVDAYLLDFLQSRRIHDSNMEELVVPSDVKFWVFLTSNDERDLSDALMRRVRRVNVDRPSRSTVASVLGIEENAALLDIWELTEKLAISQMRNYLEDGGDPQDIDLDILSQYVDDLPDLSTLAEQKTVALIGQDDTAVVPTVVRVRLYDNGINRDFISKLESFKWLPDDNGVLVEIPKLTDLSLLQTMMMKSNIDFSIPYCNTDGEHRMIIDRIDPVISNCDGGIFVIPAKPDGEPGKIVTIVAKRDAAGNYYISGDDLGSLPDDFYKALPGLVKDLQQKEFKAKHALQLKEARKAASEGQAQSLLKRLGIDDLV